MILSQLKHFARVTHSLIRESSKSKKRSVHWHYIRDQFIEDNPYCEACGSSEKLQVHHIIPFSNRPDLELVDSNLIVLCMSINECHFLLGHGGSFKTYNPHVSQDARNFRNQEDAHIRKLIVENAIKNRLD